MAPLFVAPMALPARQHRPALSSRRPIASRPMAALEVAGAARAQQVLSTLLAANEQYVQGKLATLVGETSPLLREKLATYGQAPDAAVVACADSRVAPEIVFGAGLGRVFVVRNAGNVAWGDSVVGSLEYAVSALGVPLVIVLGHTMCGAVGAAVDAAKNGGMGGESPLAAHVGRIAEVVKGEVGKADAVGEAVVKNVRDGVARLRAGDTAVATYAKNGDIAIVGAVYDIKTGKVTVVEE